MRTNVPRKATPERSIAEERLPTDASDLRVFNSEDETDRQFVTALARGLELLRCFRPGERYLGNSELARRTGIPKPTVSRLSHTLTALGYLNYSAALGKYQLGTGVLSLGYAMLSGMDVRETARPLMQDLADYSQSSVAIGARERLSMVYVENCRSSSTVTLRLDIGSRIPIATTAMGRALLCGLPDRERTYLLDHIRKRDEPGWAKTRAGVEQALREYSDHGYCTSMGDWERDVNAVGVPLLEAGGRGVMAFNCGGPSFQLKRKMLEEDIGPRLVHLVRNVEASLGRH